MKKVCLWMSVLSVFILLVFCPSLRARDIQLGGNVNAALTGIYNYELGFGLFPQINLDLELFLPSWKDNEIKCAGNLYTDIDGGLIDFFWKKLYWKHEFENLHLSIGRQPISWSFGSLLNPVDYTLGSVALDEEYSAKYQDALEAYFPFNWNTSLTLVASLDDNHHDLKVGIRGRTLINDFDFTLSFVQEKVKTGGESQKRFGITAKGDMGPFGVYGALGHYRQETDSFCILFGLDYSYFFEAGNQLYFQIEYLKVPSEILSKITGSLIFEQQEEKKGYVDLVVSTVSYQIDEFSNIRLTAFSNISDKSHLIMPIYTNQINTNTTATVQAGLIIKAEEELNTLSVKSAFSKLSQFFIKCGIDYSF